MKLISSKLGKDFDVIVAEMYLDKNFSSIEIAEKLQNLTKIPITGRSIQRMIKSLGITRTFSEAFNLAIKKGRKDYSHLKKSIKSSQLRKGISLKIRYEILKRDNFRCILCGNSGWK